MKVGVKNMKGSTGKPVPNQFIIYTDEGVYFQSYNTVIAFKPYGDDKIYLDPLWTFSQTTAKYRCQFLGMDKRETLNEIKAGNIVIKNLN